MEKRPVGSESFLEKQNQYDLSIGDNFLCKFALILLLCDFDLEIEVPYGAMRYKKLHESLNEDEKGPFAMLELKSIQSLIKDQSAHDSKAISNIKYQDDDGVWNPFPKKLYLSEQTLRRQKLEC